MRITSKGQVTIPIEIRERAGLLPNTEVDFIVDGKAIRIVRARGATTWDERAERRRPAEGPRDRQVVDRRNPRAHPRHVTPVLVDSSVILDVATNDARWSGWSRHALEQAADEAALLINPLVYAEVSVGFHRIEDLKRLYPASSSGVTRFPTRRPSSPARRFSGIGGVEVENVPAARLLHRCPRRGGWLPPAHPIPTVSEHIPRVVLIAP
jgi:AbrB family looped-hinge helix DNA binding protein